jgi:hypothetical protein
MFRSPPRRTRAGCSPCSRGFVVLAELVREAGVRVHRRSTSATRAAPAHKPRRSLAPSAQLRPTLKGRACWTECQKASVVWPESVRPEASVIVPEIITGRRAAALGEDFLDREDRRLGVQRVEDRLDQDDVGATIEETVTASVYEATSSSKVTLRIPASLTSGEMEAVRLVGPSTPATQRGRRPCASAIRRRSCGRVARLRR